MKRIKFLKPAFSFLLIALSITTASRIVLFFLFKTRVVETENYGYIFPIGLRMDLILLCYLLFLPVLLLVFLPNKILPKIQGFISGYFIFFLSILFLLELATPDFIYEYDTRPNKLFLDYLYLSEGSHGNAFQKLPSFHNYYHNSYVRICFSFDQIPKKTFCYPIRKL